VWGKLVVGQGFEIRESKYLRHAMTKKQDFLLYLFGVSHVAADNNRNSRKDTNLLSQ
jgi:hypothetical protein